jgi:FimV-like protein
VFAARYFRHPSVAAALADWMDNDMQAVNSSHRTQAGPFGAGLLPFKLSSFAAVSLALFLSGSLLAADAAPTPPPAPARDQLILLENEPQAAEGSAEDLTATIARLESELMMSEENLDRARIQYRELSQRLEMLDRQNSLLNNVIEVESYRLAKLQADLAAQNEAAAREALERGTGLSALFASRNAGLLMGVGGLVVIVVGFLFFSNARRRRAVAEAEVYDLPAGAIVDEPVTLTVGTAAIAEVASDSAAQAQGGIANELEVNPEDLRFDDTMVFDEEEVEEIAPEVNKIDLATAYMAMGNRNGALAELDEVLANGTPEQQEEARRLKDRWQG